MSISQPPQPHPENQPPGRAAFVDLGIALGNETIASQSTTRRIEAIHIIGDLYIDIGCGDSHSAVRRFGNDPSPYLTAVAGKFNSRAFSMDELAAPGGVEALFGSAPP